MLAQLLTDEPLVTEYEFANPTQLLSEDPNFADTLKNRIASRLNICACRIQAIDELNNDGRGLIVPEGKVAALFVALGVTPGSQIEFSRTEQVRFLQPGMLVGWQADRGTAQLPLTGTGQAYFIA